MEDRPWVMTGFISEMEQKVDGEAESRTFRKPEILYFIAGDTPAQRMATEKNYKEEVSHFEEATGIKVKKIDKTVFHEEMEGYYSKDYVIFMDLNLTGNSAMYFNERINVQYAREKQKQKGGGDGQIWFYTTGASLDADFLSSEFPNNVIEVINFVDGKAQLDMEKSWQVLCGSR